MNKDNLDTVISTRIRLARNLKDIPFKGRMTKEQKNDIKKRVEEAVINDKDYSFNYLDMENVTNIQAGSMVEAHLISLELANNKEGAGLILSKDKSISIMINEEDHLRIQLLGKGLKLYELYEVADKLDDKLDSSLNFAFSDRLGYLTYCPTNLGTGLRASVMMHLPALTESGLINKVINFVSQMGLTVRGLYGEGTQPGGCIYQVSNQVSLGISEKETLTLLQDVVSQIDGNEHVIRKKMMENIQIKDRIYRAYGILKEVRLLSSVEFTQLLSDVRFGATEGLIKVDINDLDNIFIEAQPYSLMLCGREALEIQQRDVIRADMVREVFNKASNQ